MSSRAVAATDVEPRARGFERITMATVRAARSSNGTVRGAIVFLLYTALSIAVFALPVIGHLGDRCVGSCLSDTNLYTWSFAWMSHAIHAGQDPLFSDVVWAPSGIHLAWVTSLPGPALLMVPVTDLFGPLASVNVLMIAAPASAAWAMYLVCAQVTRRFWPSVFGGLVFGFSTYMNQHQRAQLNLILVFFIPLAVYLVLRRMNGSLGRIAFVLLLGLTLAGQFLTSTEVFATALLMAGCISIGVLVLAPDPIRRRFLRTVPLIAAAGLVTALLISPVLLGLVRDAPAGEAFRTPELNSVDLLSFVVPPPIARFGGSTFSGLSDRFPGYPQNDTAYMGVVFLAIAIWCVVTFRRVWWSWLLVGAMIIPGVLALGPTLHIAGDPSIPMPQRLLLRIPLIRYATADRLPLYLWVALSILVAVWLAAGASRWRWARYALVALGVVLLSIDLGTDPNYHGSLDVPAFFQDGAYQRFAGPDDVVLGIPSQIGGDMVWQASTDMGFRLGRAYVGPVHPEGADALGLRVILSGSGSNLPPANVLRTFIEGRGVKAVFAEEPVSEDVSAWLHDVLGTDPESVDGVSVWTVPAQLPPLSP
ncbi:MAG TPA: hypothetical protein VHW68_09360 [Actinomycetota bacterium]|jgi:hypothetical protein|nr:hypothetical protein [Actinomycetota bacterium]